jgi:hypothetical protein
LVNSANKLVNRLVQMSQESASFSAKILSSLTRARDVAAPSFGPGASLEPRCAGQNTGLRILIYSWKRDDEWTGILPMTWPTSWFGVLEWPASWFGPLPEDERVFV